MSICSIKRSTSWIYLTSCSRNWIRFIRANRFKIDSKTFLSILDYSGSQEVQAISIFSSIKFFLLSFFSIPPERYFQKWDIECIFHIPEKPLSIFECDSMESNWIFAKLQRKLSWFALTAHAQNRSIRIENIICKSKMHSDQSSIHSHSHQIAITRMWHSVWNDYMNAIY